jgi:deoxyribodipyrimidine photolyase
MLNGILSPFLYERCNIRAATSASSSQGQHFVLYVCTCALRTYENPALDSAVAISKFTGKPLVVHSFFDDRGLHATARRAVFIIESIRDLDAKYKSMGIHFTFQLIGRKDTSREPAFLTLASRSSYVVTDEPFVEPHLNIVRRLERIKSATLITVDTSLEIPAKLVSKQHVHRAYSYRNAIANEFRKRCLQPYPASNFANLPTLPSSTLSNLPTRLFVDFNELEYPSGTRDLVQTCTSLDHSVSPVDHTRGGMSAAKVRWCNFLKHGMKKYHKTRNNPLQHHQHGVSRISPYLNLGVISPFKVGRDVCKTFEKCSSSSSSSSS